MKQQKWAWSSAISYWEREVYKCMIEAKPLKLWVIDTIYMYIKHVVVRLGHYDGTNMMS